MPDLVIDSQTGNLVYQEMGTDAIMGVDNHGCGAYKNPPAGWGRSLAVENPEKEAEAATLDVEERLASRARVEKRPANFKFSAEYYEAIKDERQRMAAYKELVVTAGIADATDEELRKNPYEFLQLPEVAPFADVRGRYFFLSRQWHPDRMNPKSLETLERVFAEGGFPIGGETPPTWHGKIIQEEADNWEIGEKAPLPGKELAELSAEERETYLSKKEAYHKTEQEVARVKSAMIGISTRKMTLLNKAYKLLLERGSAGHTLAGYGWEKVVSMPELSGDSPLARALGLWDDSLAAFEAAMREHCKREYLALSLEGPGEIRKKTPKDPDPVLSFDYGDAYLWGGDYRQQLSLPSFFAWMSHRKGGLIPDCLLEPLAKEYSLDESKRRQLNLMIQAGETFEFIQEAFKIPEEEAKNLEFFLDDIYIGPTYVHDDGPARSWDAFRLGVEMTQAGELVLKYVSQEDQSGFWSHDEKKDDRFTKTDFQQMVALAYGPVLSPGS